MLTFQDADVLTRLVQLNARLSLKLRRGEYLAIVIQKQGVATGFMRSTDADTAILGALGLAERRAALSEYGARQHQADR